MKRAIYKVVDKRQEGEKIITLFIELEDGSIPNYRPGQFIKVYFPEFSIYKGKEYSISSAPHEGVMAITVRGVGRYSNRLCDMKINDTFLATLPTGLFNLDRNGADTIMIAGGMGITPFRGIIYDIVKRNPKHKLRLLHSAHNLNDVLYKDEFGTIKQKNKNLYIQRFVTGEKPLLKEDSDRHIEEKDILEVIKSTSDPDFMVCGSTNFNINYKKQLLDMGISRDKIYSETIL